MTGQAGVAQFTDACVNDPAVLALRGKVGVVRDGRYATTAAEVAIATADGVIHKLSQPAARGSEANPMSDKDIEAKLRVAAADAIPGNDISSLIDAIWTLDRSRDISKLAALTVPHA